MKATNDFRVQLPDDVLIELEVEARSRGTSMQDVARDVFVSWTRSRLHAANLRTALRRAKGLRMEDDGMGRIMTSTEKPDHE